VLVATPNAGMPFPWLDVMSRVRTDVAGAIAPSDLTPKRFGELVVDRMRASRERELERAPEHAPFILGEAMACLDLTRAARTKHAIDELARALAASDDAREIVASVRGAGSESTVLHYVMPEEPQAWLDTPYYDAFDLARRLADEARLSDDVRSRARTLADAVDALVVASFGMQRYGDFEPGRNGVHVTFPNGELEDAYGSSHYRYLGWLHPGDRKNTPNAFGRYAWRRDGATSGNGVVESWFELLESWYDGEDTNGYAW